MYDLISIGDITVDFFFKGSSLTERDNRFFLAIGGKYEADFFHESLGGGGANVAVGAAHLGLSSAVMGTIGENPFKQMIVANLVKNTVSCNLLKVEREFYNISSIFLNEKGERTVVHYRTPDAHLVAIIETMRTIGQTRMVYMGNLPGTPHHERVLLLEHFKKAGAYIILNLGIKDCREGCTAFQKLFASADILIINTHEYAELIKADYESLDFRKNQANHIGFGDKVLVLTDGEKGSWGYMNNQIFYQKAIAPKKIIDTTGAGDGYTSGFIASYIHDHNLPKALKNGALYSSKILAKIGAQETMFCLSKDLFPSYRLA